MVAVPIETRYAGHEAGLEFRKSHFRLFRDLASITSHVVGQVLTGGRLLDAWRATRRRAPVVFDPDAPPDARH